MSVVMSTCGEWQRGLDCSFDMWSFHFSWLVIWAVTSAVLVGVSFAMKLGGIAQRCTNLIAAACIVSCLNSAYKLLNGQPDDSKFDMASAFLLGLAIVDVVDHWRDEAMGLLFCTMETAGPRTSSIVTGISYGFRFVALLLMPLVAMRINETVEVSPYSTVAADLIQCSLLTITCMAILLAVAMMVVSWRRFQDVAGAAYLRKTSSIVCWLFVVILIFSLYSALVYYLQLGGTKFGMYEQAGEMLEAHAWISFVCNWCIQVFFAYGTTGLKKEELDIRDKLGRDTTAVFEPSTAIGSAIPRESGGEDASAASAPSPKEAHAQDATF